MIFSNIVKFKEMFYRHPFFRYRPALLIPSSVYIYTLIELGNITILSYIVILSVTIIDIEEKFLRFIAQKHKFYNTSKIFHPMFTI